MVTRRALLAAAGSAAIAGTAGRLDAAAPVTLRLSSASAPGDFLTAGMTTFKDAVEKADAGIAVATYPGSTLFKQGTEVPAIQRGNLEMSTMTTFEVAQQMPQFGCLNRGYLIRDYAHLHRVFGGLVGAEYTAAVVATMGIRILATAYLGTRQVALRHRRPVTGPGDLAGVKMRMPAGPEWQLLGRAIGTEPVPMGSTEMYLGLKTGTIDGEENPISIYNANKLYEVTEQVVLTAHLVQPVFFAIAEPVWQKLTPQQQGVVLTAALAGAKTNDDGRLGDEATVTTALKGRGIAVDAVDLAGFRALADKVYAAAPAAKAWDPAFEKRVTDLATA